MNDNLEHGWIVNDREKEIEAVYTCGWCGEPIYDGGDYYDFDGEKVCEQCVRNCRKTAYK